MDSKGGAASNSFHERLLEAKRQTGQAGGVALPTPVPHWAPFPVDALPLTMARFVLDSAAAMNCDPAYLALPALAAAAGAVGNSRSLRIKQSWTEPAVLWTVVIGESGTLKTPAWKRVVLPLFKLQARLNRDHKEDLAHHKIEQEEHRERVRRAKDAGRDRPSPPVTPLRRKVVTSDVTIEKLAMILEDNPRGIFITRDELSGWFGSFQRYKSGSGSDLPNWLELHSAGVVVVDRKTGERPDLTVPFASASVTGTIQPAVLAQHLTPHHYEAGLAARLLLGWPPRRRKEWTDAEGDEELERRWGELLERLLALPMRTTADGREHLPHRLDLSARAHALWVDFYNEWAIEQSSAEGELAAAFSKLEAYASRFALLHHVITMVDLDSDDLRPVTDTSMTAGIRLTRWFADEARRCYVMLSESETERQTRHLLDWVSSRGGRVTARELQRSNQRRYRTADIAESVLEDLVRCGLGSWRVVQPEGDQGGRPTRIFELAPESTLNPV